MTPAQSEARDERIGIMMFEAGATREEAEKYCDGLPHVYGIRDRKEEQKELL